MSYLLENKHNFIFDFTLTGCLTFSLRGFAGRQGNEQNFRQLFFLFRGKLLTIILTTLLLYLVIKMRQSDRLNDQFRQLGLDLPEFCVVKLELQNRTQYECACNIPDLNIIEFALSANAEEAKEMATSKVMEKITELNLLTMIH